VVGAHSQGAAAEWLGGKFQRQAGGRALERELVCKIVGRAEEDRGGKRSYEEWPPPRAGLSNPAEIRAAILARLAKSGNGTGASRFCHPLTGGECSMIPPEDQGGRKSVD